MRLTAVSFGDLDTDPAWDVVPVVVWTTAEVLTGVIIASLTTLRPLIAHFMPGWASSSDTAKASTAVMNSGGNRYRLSSLPSRGTHGVSSSDGESALIYPARMFSSAAWLELEGEFDQDQGATAPEPVKLKDAPGRSMQPSSGASARHKINVREGGRYVL